MSNSDSKFMQDEELRNLLNKWSVPEAPGSLDQRVAAAFQQATISMNEHLSSVIDPQRDSEVVKMKFCNTCQEQFADRFSFCPVDGTPLSEVQAATVASPKASAPADVEASYPISETVSQITPKATVPSLAAQSASPAPASPIQSLSVEPEEVTSAVTPSIEVEERAAWPPHIVPKMVFPAAARSRGAPAHEMIGEYHLTMLEDRSLASRLSDELGNV